MSLGTPLAVVLTLLFFIPGFLWKETANLASPYVARRDTPWLHYFALSCFNYLIALPVVFLLVAYRPVTIDISKMDTIAANPSYIFAWLSLVFVLPVLCGYVTAKLTQADSVKVLRRKIGLWALHPAPTAWDYAFARDSRYWARVELTDGSLVEGLFDSNSLASGERDNRDIFLETIFELDSASGEYKQVERNAGILIRAESIRSITFFIVDGDETEATVAQASSVTQGASEGRSSASCSLTGIRGDSEE